MTAYLNLDDHFKTTIAKDLSALLLGDCDGYGTYRAIYHHATDPTLIVKVEPGAQSFSNVREWDVWNRIKDTKYARWFAPVVDISPNGAVLLMRKCQQVRAEELPDYVPAFFTDLKAENWGLLGKQYVCLDYGNHLLLEHGMTSRMRRARWTDSSG